MFVRTKTIKGNPYGYLVENEWTKKGSRQKVVEYLGRIYEHETGPERAFPEHEGMNILKEIVIYETPDDVNVDFEKLHVTRDEKPVVLGINGGVLCSQTLQQVFEALKTKYEERPGITLARALRNAGLRIRQEDFIRLYVSTRP